MQRKFLNLLTWGIITFLVTSCAVSLYLLQLKLFDFVSEVRIYNISITQLAFSSPMFIRSIIIFIVSSVFLLLFVLVSGDKNKLIRQILLIFFFANIVINFAILLFIFITNNFFSVHDNLWYSRQSIVYLYMVIPAACLFFNISMVIIINIRIASTPRKLAEE